MFPDQKPVTGAAALLDELLVRREEAITLTEKRAADRQHAKGKLTARERIELLADPGSFLETGELVRHGGGPYGDGVVTGQASVDGRPVCVFAHDFSVLGGSM